MKEICYEKKGRIALVGIDRPKALNALSKAIVDDLGRTIDQISQDPGIRVLVLYSRGNFAAGADIKDMVSCGEEEAKDFSFSPVFHKIEALPFPAIAAIEGYALGGGLELALTCDLRFVSEDAKLGFPEINLGIMPGAGGTIRTPGLIGLSAAKELIFSGETISAQRALSLGLVNRLFSKEDLLTQTLLLAEKLANKAPVALRTAKRTMNMGAAEPDKEKAIGLEAANWAQLFTTEDQKEGMAAFLEKRKPVYRGK